MHMLQKGSIFNFEASATTTTDHQKRAMFKDKFLFQTSLNFHFLGRIIALAPSYYFFISFDATFKIRLYDWYMHTV